MERLLGLLKVKVVRGLNLAICDPLSHSSDPYVVIRLGQQEVFDHDTFTKDDTMGDAEFGILDFVEIAMKDLSHVRDDTVMKTFHPEEDNCFSADSHITWKDGKVSQNIYLKLRNTDTGEIVMHLEWVNIPGMAR
ncbi:protein C2-DOMAIN ABA-RELATED 5-like isoform X2 [Hordeum vulgare subsp. vulgare]|uniref:protein C2-DOMAIN ABA-RELATED 5-like isoform X2 n=1 Tax=Hordeum vulgare subsp. vulgare TaxID=112509 RepID=UPI000294FC55|nr:protein C2-DOMAIN ABA-RELATED 5-like isoform X2 [Hordeum vulgare subsp. vulgare]